MTKVHAARAVLAKNIRLLRAKKGVSQEALAEISGIHRTYISSVERGQRNVAIDNIERLACALSVNPHELLDPDYDAR